MIVDLRGGCGILVVTDFCLFGSDLVIKGGCGLVAMVAATCWFGSGIGWDEAAH